MTQPPQPKYSSQRDKSVERHLPGSTTALRVEHPNGRSNAGERIASRGDFYAELL
jgi:hypothetical protein